MMIQAMSKHNVSSRFEYEQTDKHVGFDANGNEYAQNDTRRVNRVKGSWQKLRKHIAKTKLIHEDTTSNSNKIWNNINGGSTQRDDNTSQPDNSNTRREVIASKWQILIKQLSEMNAVTSAQEARLRASEDSDASPVSRSSSCDSSPFCNNNGLATHNGYQHVNENKPASNPDVERRRRIKVRWQTLIAKVNSEDSEDAETNTDVEMNAQIVKENSVSPLEPDAPSKDGSTDSINSSSAFTNHSDPTTPDEDVFISADESNHAEPQFLKVTSVRNKWQNLVDKTRNMPATTIADDSSEDGEQQADCIKCNNEVADFLSDPKVNEWDNISNGELQPSSERRIRRRSTPDSIRFSCGSESSDTVNDRNQLEPCANSTELVIRKAKRAKSLIRDRRIRKGCTNFVGPARIPPRHTTRRDPITRRQTTESNDMISCSKAKRSAKIEVSKNSVPADVTIRSGKTYDNVSVKKSNSVKGKWQKLRKHIGRTASKSSTDMAREVEGDINVSSSLYSENVKLGSDDSKSKTVIVPARRRKLSLPIGSQVTERPTRRQSSANNLIDAHILRALSSGSMDNIHALTESTMSRRTSIEHDDVQRFNLTAANGTSIKSARRRHSRQEIPTLFTDIISNNEQ